MRWAVDFTEMFGAKVPFYGYASSPLIEGEHVIVEPGASVAALDELAGKVAWQAGDDPAPYASSVALDQDGERCVVAFTAAGRWDGALE